MSSPINLIFTPGTRIVTRNETNRIGGGELVTSGAVAVITQSPADAKHAYKVRFNDGAEAMLRRNEFSILKEFKTEEAVGRDSAPASSDFEFWKPFIIYRCVVGSQAFGLSSDDSDVDRRGIYLPPAELHWSLYGAPEQIENNDTQEAYWELQKFLVMALKANPNILECLHTPLAKGCITRNHSHHYFGFAETQWKLFDKERPRRVKPLLYVYRVLLTGIHLMRTGVVNANLVELNEETRLPCIADLIGRKQSGENSTLEDADVAFHRREYERLRGELQAAHDACKLPESPSEDTRVTLNNMLVRIRLDLHQSPLR